MLERNATLSIFDATETKPEATANRLMGLGLERVSLCVILFVAGMLRTVRLEQDGYGNTYYSAAVRSMLASWTNFFFGSFDPLGFVTVDKPPVALWIQAVSAKILGYSGISLLLPQALLGTLSVWLTYAMVRRFFGPCAGLIAGLCLAITPIGVALDRDNLPDSALVFTLLLAAWALLRSVETGRLGLLLLSTALVGIGFNIKMLAAFIVLPTYYLVYDLAAPFAWKPKLAHLALATAVLAGSSFSWSIVVELTPKSRRPYIGGSRNNSAMELALGYNGIARIMGMGGFGPGGGRPPAALDVAPDSEKSEATTNESSAAEHASGAAKSAALDKTGTRAATDAGPSEASVARVDAQSRPRVPEPPSPGLPPFPPGGPRGMPGFGGKPGLFRFANPTIAGQITWLFPLAVVGIVCVAGRSQWRLPISPQAAALVIWSGWFLTHWFLFSFARGIFHEYYTYVMGPPVAALAGVAIVALWREFGLGRWHSLLLPATLFATSAWQVFIFSRYPAWNHWLIPIAVAGTAIAGAGLLTARYLAKQQPAISWSLLATALGIATVLVGPAVWSLTPVLAKGNAMMPTADPALITGDESTIPFTPPMGLDLEGQGKLVEFLEANHHGEEILLAAPGSMDVSNIITETGKAAVSLGGFGGMDRVFSKEEFVAMVDQGRVRFVLISPGPGGGGPPPGFGGPRGAAGGPPPGFGPPGGGPPPGMGNAETLEWVRGHGKEVDPKLWRTDPPRSDSPDDIPESPAFNDPSETPNPFMNPRAFFGRMRRMTKLYDCKPGLALIAP